MMFTMIEMRRAQETDAETLSQLILTNAKETLAINYSTDQWNAFISYYSPEVMRSKIAQQKIFCAILENEIVGTIALDQNFVVGFYTRTQNMNQGIGSFMLQFLENYAQELGLTEIQLAASPVGVSFYLKNGWAKIKDITISYSNDPFEETLMSKKIQQSENQN